MRNVKSLLVATLTIVVTLILLCIFYGVMRMSKDEDIDPSIYAEGHVFSVYGFGNGRQEIADLKCRSIFLDILTLLSSQTPNEKRLDFDGRKTAPDLQFYVQRKGNDAPKLAFSYYRSEGERGIIQTTDHDYRAEAPLNEKIHALSKCVGTNYFVPPGNER
jgi:hypothetical protein